MRQITQRIAVTGLLITLAAQQLIQTFGERFKFFMVLAIQLVLLTRFD